MPTLILRFPAGRYHTTPWGYHVNEGMIEWPPSPWRVLRALLATGYATLQWSAEGPPPDARSLVEKLAAVLPVYHLPKAVGTHSRHYMPMARFKNGREETNLVFDTWARVSGELAIDWDVELSTQECALLEQLLQRIGYLGRSESWIDARLATEHDMPDGQRCWPEGNGAPPGIGWEQVAVLAPVPASEYEVWRELAVARVLSGLELPEQGKKPTAKLKKAMEKAIKPYPVDLVSCLQMQTNELQDFGWSQPPGSRRVFYWRKADALETGVPHRRRVQKRQAVEAMLLSVTTQSGNNHALPPLMRTLPQAEHLHRQLVGILRGKHNRSLTGCDENHLPLRGAHEHAHILPLDLDEDGHLEHVLIWASMGLDADAQTAVRQLRRTFTKGGIGPLRVAVAASAARLNDLASMSGYWGMRLGRYIGKGREWRSATSFVPPRYLKKRGTNTLEAQVQAELASRGFPDADRIEVLDPHENDMARRQRHIVRVRRFGPTPPIDQGFTLKISFSEPVRGPICLGYGSHYGLGQFELTRDG